MQRNASTDELYFATLTVVDWIDVFTRRYYNDFIIKNLAWCQQNANLNIYSPAKLSVCAQPDIKKLVRKMKPHQVPLLLIH